MQDMNGLRGFAVSRLRRVAEEFAQWRTAGEAAATELARPCGNGRETPPDLFFCYHPYYKAPDFLGPRLSATFGIPYVTAEASFSSRRGIGPWADAQAAGRTRCAMRPQSLLHRRDREGLLEGVAGRDSSR